MALGPVDIIQRAAFWGSRRYPIDHPVSQALNILAEEIQNVSEQEQRDEQEKEE